MKKRNKFLLIPLIILTLLMSTVLFGCEVGDPKPNNPKPGDATMWKVTFNYNYTGALPATVVNVADGKTVSQPSAPTRPEHEFTGWFTNAACSTRFIFTTTIKADTQLYAGWKEEEVITDRTGITGLRFTNAVTDFAGTWNVVKVYAGGTTKDAVANAITLSVEIVEARKNVNDAEYIRNLVSNLVGSMTFGIKAINDILSANNLNNYDGAANWDTFTMGKVAAYDEKYIQPGPAVMTFPEMRDYGLYLEHVAGITGIDTERNILVIGLNSDGQLLLGYSKVALEFPSVNGDWEYCLIFDKA